MVLIIQKLRLVIKEKEVFTMITNQSFTLYFQSLIIPINVALHYH